MTLTSFSLPVSLLRRKQKRFERMSSTLLHTRIMVEALVLPLVMLGMSSKRSLRRLRTRPPSHRPAKNFLSLIKS